jgi:hypothetical protein
MQYKHWNTYKLANNYMTLYKDSKYEIAIAPIELWQQAVGVTHPDGNPTVGEFTRRHARMTGYDARKEFQLRG